MQTVAIVIHLMIVATLIATVLLQKSEGGGLGVGGGAGFMSSRGTANLLTRTTAVLAFGFFLTSLFLSWYAGLRPQAEFDHWRSASLAVAAGGRGSAGGPADQRRSAGFAEEGGRAAAAESAGAHRVRRRRVRNKAGWLCGTVSGVLHQGFPSRY